jgi:16S rRNA processing protein RimM
MSGQRRQLRLGTVAGTHGIRGGLRVRTFSGEYDVLVSIETVRLLKPDGTSAQMEVASVRPHGRQAVLTFKGLDSINLVTGLVGSELWVDREQLPPLPEGEYYWCDLIGMTVLLEDGRRLGEIASIIPTGSNDVYVVDTGEREVLVPAIEDVVLNIDPAAGSMRVALLEGLLD